MKKTWNRVILICFILMVVVASATLIFLYPYYNKYKVFEGIEAGQWSEVQKSYEALDSEKQQSVQALLPDYAKHCCLEYQTGEKDYLNTIAAFDAINSIDETKSICAKYNTFVNRLEYKKAIETIYNANKEYNGQGVVAANETINNIHMRLDAETRKEVVVEVLNDKYQEFVTGQITLDAVNSYIAIIIGLASTDVSQYAEIVASNVQVVQAYRDLFVTAENAYNTGDYFTAINICQSVQLDPADETYIDKYFSLYELAYTTGMNYYDSLLDYYIDCGDSKNAVSLLEKLEKYYADDMDIEKYKLSLASDWQKAYVKLAADADTILRKALADTEDGINILDTVYDDICPDSLLLYDVDDNGIPELFLFNSEEKNDTYTSCFIFTFADGNYQYLGYARVRSFCDDSTIVAFPWASSRTSGDEYCLKRYGDGILTDGPYVQDVDGVYYVNGQEVDKTAYLSAQSETLAHEIGKGVKDFDTVTLEDGESYILAY